MKRILAIGSQRVKTVLSIQVLLRETFLKRIFVRVIKTYDTSAIVHISAMFGTL